MGRFNVTKGWGHNSGTFIITARSGGVDYLIGGSKDESEATSIAEHFNHVLEHGLGECGERA